MNFLRLGLPEKKLVSELEYLELEINSVEKHEYYQGEIFAMAGATVEHNRIASNTFVELGSGLKNKNCVPYNSDLRIHAQTNSLYTYPDISVICGEVEKLDNVFDTVTNPTVLIEILSESTRDYDRGTKFMLYRDIASLREYLVIDSTGSIHAEKYFKESNNEWILREYKSLDDTFKLESLDVDLNMADIYRGVY
ncbi:MAG: Uma2 family endonuclease [Saprospiraceae bacterium]|nr:Uma2 family endonuclease [Saprospiraceae bacterium]